MLAASFGADAAQMAISPAKAAGFAYRVLRNAKLPLSSISRITDMAFGPSASKGATIAKNAARNAADAGVLNPTMTQAARNMSDSVIEEVDFENPLDVSAAGALAGTALGAWAGRKDFDKVPSPLRRHAPEDRMLPRSDWHYYHIYPEQIATNRVSSPSTHYPAAVTNASNVLATMSGRFIDNARALRGRAESAREDAPEEKSSSSSSSSSSQRYIGRAHDAYKPASISNDQAKALYEEAVKKYGKDSPEARAAYLKIIETLVGD